MCLAPIPTLPDAPESDNLCARLGEWLRFMGFQQVDHDHSVDNCQYLAGTWVALYGARFKLEYCWAPGQPAHMTCSLWVEWGGATQMLVWPHLVTKLKHVQRLLLNCLRFREAYLADHPGADLPI